MVTPLHPYAIQMAMARSVGWFSLFAAGFFSRNA
jgi:hypothetical protein